MSHLPPPPPGAPSMTMVVTRKQADWYTWLRRTGLDPSLVYDYSILFSENELDEGDLPHFDHAFLHSMGVSIAKHRLQIMKLARSDSSRARMLLRPVSRFVSAAVRMTKRRIAGMLVKRDWRRGEEETGTSALVVVERPTEALVVGAVLKRSRSLGQKKLLGAAAGGVGIAHRHSCEEARGRLPRRPVAAAAAAVAAGAEGGYFAWDSMFEDMKPT